MTELISFHGKQEIKDNLLKQLKAHYEADEIIKGKYWKNGKGCAVGCSVHSSDHFEYEKQLGISVVLAKLEDSIFEGLPNKEAKEFPIKFIEAIPVGVNLDSVFYKFFAQLIHQLYHKTQKIYNIHHLYLASKK